MPEYAPGTPLWVDVSSPDLDRSRAFYKGLFGWTSEVVAPPEAGNYTMFFRDGKLVAGGGATMSPDQHPAWSTYVSTSDADASVQAATEAGGQVLMGPMDVMGQGRMAVLRDSAGAHVSIWQPQMHTGAQLVNEPGSFCWNELYTRDMPAAQAFYAKVFGWDAQEDQFDGGAYTVFKVGGRPIAGGLDMSAMLPADVPPHWLVYFTVTNTADAVAKAKELGGTILQEPKDTPMGPIAVIRDPGGAAFAVIQAAAQS
jgi:predicted enzyme related to lactoylglutathione lyase